MMARKIYIADGEKEDFPITEGVEIVEDPEIAEIIVFAQKRPLCYEYISDIDIQSKYKKYIEDSQNNTSTNTSKTNKITPNQLNILEKLNDANKTKIYEKYNVKELGELNMLQANEIIGLLRKAGNK